MKTAGTPEPRLYMRLAAALRTQISNGVYAESGRLPSINALCHEHGLSRQTAGKALRILEDEGLVHRVPGLGYHLACDARPIARSPGRGVPRRGR